jgi:hypothetical protein
MLKQALPCKPNQKKLDKRDEINGTELRAATAERLDRRSMPLYWRC